MNAKSTNRLITLVSIAIPLVVAVLFRVKIDGFDFHFLPPIYATINGVTFCLLISALWAIRNGNKLLHERLMKTCIGLSLLFLIMYVLYHMTSDSTPYGGEGLSRYVYFFILISHVLLSIAVVPLVLFTYARAVNGDFVGHKRLARVTFPIWLYVAFTGVVVYLMISPYYI